MQRKILLGGFVLSLWFMAGSALADTFPSKPINLWAGCGAESGTDVAVE